MRMKSDWKWSGNIMQSSENVEMFWKFSRKCDIIYTKYFSCWKRTFKCWLRSLIALKHISQRFYWQNDWFEFVFLILMFVMYSRRSIQWRTTCHKSLRAQITERKMKKKIDNWLEVKLNSLKIRLISIKKASKKRNKKKKN